MDLQDRKIQDLIEQFDDGGLSRAESEVFVCREVLDFDRNETADRLDKAASTVDSQHQSAKVKIDNLMNALERSGARFTELQPYE